MFTNRSLAALLAVTVLLIIGAAVVNFGLPAMVPPTQVEQADDLLDVPPEIYRHGGKEFTPTGPVRVSGQDDLLVSLDCDGFKLQRTIRGGSTTFEEIPPISCGLKLGRGDPAPFTPTFRGDDVRCALDEEETMVWCDNTLASQRAATVVAWSWGKGEVWLNGERVGSVPVENLRVPIGSHVIEFRGEKARSRSPLTVGADEHIEVFFHSPSRPGQSYSRRPESATMMPKQP